MTVQQYPLEEIKSVLGSFSEGWTIAGITTASPTRQQRLSVRRDTIASDQISNHRSCYDESKARKANRKMRKSVDWMNHNDNSILEADAEGMRKELARSEK